LIPKTGEDFCKTLDNTLTQFGNIPALFLTLFARLKAVSVSAAAAVGEHCADLKFLVVEPGTNVIVASARLQRRIALGIDLQRDI